jgi:hypothetical protein
VTSSFVDFPGDENERYRARRQRVRRSGAIGSAAGRTLPHSIESEEYLLSCCLLDGVDVLSRCMKAGISGESFYDPKHQIIYERMLMMLAAGKEIDVSVLAQEMKTAKQLDQVGGYAFLTQVSSRIPTTAQAGYFIEKVREQALLREIILSATAAVEDCYGFTGGIDEFCARQEERLLGVARARLGVGRASGKSLPRLMPWGELVGAAPRPEPPQLVEGLIHRGGKVMLGGGSKSFKTWCLADLGLSVSTGAPWWGLRTTRGRVLYVNFELQPWSFEGRIRQICERKALALNGDGVPSFVSWHLRGYAADLAELIPQFLVQTVGSKFDMIILDPIYKCLGERDENANGEVAGLLNEVEALAVRSDAAVVFGHHFSKGNQAGKDSKDRVSGAGAWVRDPDTVITLTPHEEEECFTAEFTLRDLKPRAPMVVRWAFPCMLADGKLDPGALRQPGAPNKWTAETVVELLRKEKAYGVASGLSYSKLEAIAKKKPTAMSESTFKRKLGEAKEMGRVECMAGLYFVEE